MNKDAKIDTNDPTVNFIFLNLYNFMVFLK